MSTVRMQRLRIIGVKEEKKEIVGLLSRSGCFEVSSVPLPESVSLPAAENTGAEAFLTRRAKVSFAIEYSDALLSEALEQNLAANKSAKKSGQTASAPPFEAQKEKASFVRGTLGYGDYRGIAAKENELLSAIAALEKISFARQELRSQIQKLNTFNRRLEPFLPLEIPFSRLGDTKTASSMLAFSPAAIKDKQPFDGIPAYLYFYPCEYGSLVGAVCKKEDKEIIAQRLTGQGFSLCGFTYNKTARELTDQNSGEIKSLEAESEKLLREGLLVRAQYLPDFKALCDILTLESERAEAEQGFLKTESTFTAEGWVPAALANDVAEELKAHTDKVYIEIRDPREGDEPPTLLQNAKLIKPFEPITNNFSPPAYGELDPSPVMSFFFFVFFGIMLGDAGYGLLLSLGAFIILRFVKMETAMKRSILMFGICGISGIIFGILFGGVFSIEGVPPLPVIGFNPIEEPMKMLVFSLILGSIHLMTGYTLKMIKKIKTSLEPGISAKQKVLRVFDGIFDAVFIYMLFAGVGVFLLPSLLPASSFPFTTVAFILLGGAMLGILLTNGRHAKGIGGKIAGGGAGLYGLISLFSDVLSYSRLFGLALSSGAIGMAFNMIGSMLFGIPVIGYVIGGLILVVLHLFNFALGALGAYVHDIRLQYLEFYGKFYDGDGRMFAPMGENTKYVRFIEK